jgi:GNAT superfamily N-acetyltransferase
VNPVPKIRPMVSKDLPGARRLQFLEGWNQSIEDWKLFIDSNPGGCFVAVVPEGSDSDDAVVGTVASIRYGKVVCWISMVLVDPEYRGRGIGGRLMQHVINANERHCDCLRLDATPAGRSVYERLGFRAEYGLERWMCNTPAAGGGIPHKLIPLDDQLLTDLLPFDRAVFGADRSIVLKHLIRTNPRCGWFGSQSGKNVSYILGRFGEKYYQIGPLVAQHPREIDDLVQTGIVMAGNRSIAIDILVGNNQLHDSLESSGFRFQRPFTRMSRGISPLEQAQYSLAIAGPEFG